jgi:hypothetical protein
LISLLAHCYYINSRWETNVFRRCSIQIRNIRIKCKDEEGNANLEENQKKAAII